MIHLDLVIEIVEAVVQSLLVHDGDEMPLTPLKFFQVVEKD